MSLKLFNTNNPTERDLNELMVMPNIADELTEGELAEISSDVSAGFQEDLQSMEEWIDDAEASLKLAKLITEPKDHPWPGAANVKFPLVAEACIQFSAITSPEIVRNGKVVEARAIGKDPDGSKEERARRISEHMSYQLLLEDTEWEESLDKLLPMLSVVGTVHKKTWYDPIHRKNVSELCNYDELILNNSIKSLATARRVSHIIKLHKNQLIERIRAGLYTDILEEVLASPGMEDDMHEVVEQHTYADIDGDHYEEPYIITYHRETGKILRIVARFDEDGITRNTDEEVVTIKPVQYFTDFHFLPSPSGEYFSMGFGTLLRPLNATINTTINQLLDAGYLANTQGGFIGRGLRIKGGSLRVMPGEWKKVDTGQGSTISQNVVPLNYKEPSSVLFQLLGVMIEVGKDLSSITSIMKGEQPAQNAPATTVLALIEQGLKVFGSIHKRLYRSLKKEFEKLYRLNRLFLDPEVYLNILDDELAVLQSDYESQSFDITPVSDPNVSSDAQRLARSNALLQLVGQPGVNAHEVIRRYLTDLGTPNLEAVLPPPNPQAPPPPEAQKIMAEIEEKAMKLQLEKQRVMIESHKLDAELKKLESETIRNIATAEAMEPGQQLAQYKAISASLIDAEKVKLQREQLEQPPQQPGE